MECSPSCKGEAFVSFDYAGLCNKYHSSSIKHFNLIDKSWKVVYRIRTSTEERDHTNNVVEFRLPGKK